jgi:hypothetical protein
MKENKMSNINVPDIKGRPIVKLDILNACELQQYFVRPWYIKATPYNNFRFRERDLFRVSFLDILDLLLRGKTEFQGKKTYIYDWKEYEVQVIDAEYCDYTDYFSTQLPIILKEE